MSLATRCPACSTVFRVVRDQLRVSDGWVRCGQCQEVFNAVEGLFELSAEPAAAAPPPEPPRPPAPPPPSSPSLSAGDVDLSDPGGPEAAADVPAVHSPAVAAGPSVPSPEPDPAPPPENSPELPAPEPTAASQPTEAIETASASAPGADPEHEPSAIGGVGPVAEPGPEPQPAAEAELHTPIDMGPDTALQAEPVPSLSPSSSPAPASSAAADPEPESPPAPSEPPAEAEPFAVSPLPPQNPLEDGPSADEPVPEPSPAIATVQATEPAEPAAQAGPAEAAEAAEPALQPMREWQRRSPRRPRDPALSATTELPTAGTPRKRRKPAFMRRAEREAQWQRPAVRAVLSATVAVLGLMLAAQAALHFRDALAARWPASRPALVQACQAFGCQVAAPRALDQLRLESSKLTAGEPRGDAASATGMLRFAAELRNTAAHPVRAPALELSLTDPLGELVARRVFSPAELGLAEGTLAANATWSVDARLDVGALSVSGFSVEVFYP